MTDEEKTLLTKALCEYLPYGVYVEYSGLITRLDQLYVMHIYNGTNTIQKLDGSIDVFHEGEWSDFVDIENIKLYLRSFSSMTEKEKVEYCVLQDNIVYGGINHPPVNEDVAKYMEFLKSHFIDCFGLIEKGIAYEDKDNLYSFLENE